jgi:hypothetical protein
VSEFTDGKLKITIPGSIIKLKTEPDKEIPDAVITGPPYFRWQHDKQIQSIPNGSDGEVPRGELFDVLVQCYAGDAETRGWIQGNDGVLVPFSPDAIENHAHRTAVQFVAVELALAFDYLTISTESADPNGATEEKTPPVETEKPVRKPKANKPL